MSETTHEHLGRDERTCKHCCCLLERWRARRAGQSWTYVKCPHCGKILDRRSEK